MKCGWFLKAFLVTMLMAVAGCGSGGNGNSGSGSFTLSAVAQFPSGSTNISFSTADEALPCAFVCEATLSSGGNEELNKSFNTVLSCLNGQPLGGEVVIFDQEEIDVLSFDHPFTLTLDCVNLVDSLLDFLGGFGGSVTFEAKSGENINVGKVPLIEQAVVDVNLCLPGAIDTAFFAVFTLFCDYSSEIPEGLFGLCAAGDPEAFARILKTALNCPFCGDGEVQPEAGEECESDSDCGEGGICSEEGELDGCLCSYPSEGGGECGNGTCEGDETDSNCPSDCYCGDGVVDPEEECDPETTEVMCGIGEACVDCRCLGGGDGDGPSCGNLVWDETFGEDCDYISSPRGLIYVGCDGEDICDPATCICAAPGCNNNFTCDFNEDGLTCTHDCFVTCGDGICNQFEDTLCDPSECASCNLDGVCDPLDGETNDNCFDCPFPHCGNGTCDDIEGETPDNCPPDCPLTR